MNTFEEYLKTLHGIAYTGTDDDMPDSFERWLENQQVDDLIRYGNDYALYCVAQTKQEIAEEIRNLKF